jgi:hypothetical protein
MFRRLLPSASSFRLLAATAMRPASLASTTPRAVSIARPCARAAFNRATARRIATCTQENGEAHENTLQAVSVSADRCTVLMTLSDGVAVEADASWLWHNCACHACRQPFSGQRCQEPAELPCQPQVADAYLNSDGSLTTTFQNLEHVATVSLSDIQLLRPSRCEQGTCRTAPALRQPGQWPRSHAYSDLVTDDKALLEWLLDLAVHGAVVVKGAPAQDPRVCHHLANRISQPQVGDGACITVFPSLPSVFSLRLFCSRIRPSPF